MTAHGTVGSFLALAGDEQQRTAARPEAFARTICPASCQVISVAPTGLSVDMNSPPSARVTPALGSGRCPGLYPPARTTAFASVGSLVGTPAFPAPGSREQLARPGDDPSAAGSTCQLRRMRPASTNRFSVSAGLRRPMHRPPRSSCSAKICVILGGQAHQTVTSTSWLSPEASPPVPWPGVLVPRNAAHTAPRTERAAMTRKPRV